jgi:selenocysteine-specific elongation factor
MYIVGTSGHVDHGKTALVKALTGTDTDRLPEEKKRGLTIELGFASFTGQDGKPIGVIDVPGHERFIRNMVAGAWALQCALLVVAADDGWMKQTEDHARVLKGMGTPSVLLVVTKIDLVENHRLEKVLQDAIIRCQRLFGRSLEYCLVSAIHNIGIENLKDKIFKQLTMDIDTRSFPNCLFVDRVFTLRGAGTVVTGSLVGGSIHDGDEVLVLPEARGARIRSIQSHGCKITTALPVSRVAITLQGLKPESVQRGSVITHSADFFVGSNMIGLLFSIQEKNGPLIRNHQEVEIAFGTRHTLATLHLVKGEGILDDNPTQVVRMVLRDASPCFWNQSFICIRPGGSEIICAGKFLWEGKLANKEVRKLAQLIQNHGGVPPEITSQMHLELALFGQADMRKTVAGSLIFLGRKYIGIDSFYIEEARLQKYKTEILTAASKEGGLRFEELRNITGLPETCLSYCMQQLIDDKILFTNKQVLTTVDPLQKKLSINEKQFLDRIQAAGIHGIDSKRISKEERILLRSLTRDGYTTVLDGTLIFTMENYRMMAQKVLIDKEKGDFFSIADAKVHLPLSRKYIIPLLNKMEEDNLVERFGDKRKVL